MLRMNELKKILQMKDTVTSLERMNYKNCSEENQHLIKQLKSLKQPSRKLSELRSILKIDSFENVKISLCHFI